MGTRGVLAKWDLKRLPVSGLLASRLRCVEHSGAQPRDAGPGARTVSAVPCRVPGPTAAGAAAWAGTHLGPWAWPLAWAQLSSAAAAASQKGLRVLWHERFGSHCVALRGLAFHQLTWAISGRRLYISLLYLCSLCSWCLIPTSWCSGFSRSLLIVKNRILKRKCGSLHTSVWCISHSFFPAVSHLLVSYLRCLWFPSAFNSSSFSCLKKMPVIADQFLIQEMSVVICGK